MAPRIRPEGERSLSITMAQEALLDRLMLTEGKAVSYYDLRAAMAAQAPEKPLPKMDIVKVQMHHLRKALAHDRQLGAGITIDTIFGKGYVLRRE